ncbi:hypothetical protein E2542_SST03736 [Spatholobus suberectus]|nr:hypothetical protein E2542_SST03736 [Spatholobus suberectus]
MLNPFVCGTFHHQEEDVVPCSSPTKSKRKDSRNNNPYSNRGLDKFSALLADLDERRQKVYSQMSPHEISFVRFAYSSNDDFVPIVVKVKNKDQRKPKSEELRVKHLTSFSEQLEKSSAEEATVEERKQQPKLESRNKKNYSFSWNMLKRPSFYVPAVVILILVFLIVFGRSVATICTCVVWYVVPTLSEYDSSKPRKSVMNSKKRDYVRGWLNEMKMVTPEELASPRSGDSKAYSNDKSSGTHGHQKSW